MREKEKDLTKGINTILINEYLQTNKHDTYTMSSVLEIEDRFGVPFQEWDDRELIDFLREFDSVSPATLNTKIYLLNRLNKFIYEKTNNKNSYGMIKQITLDDATLLDCISLKKLMKVTINKAEYESLKSQLIVKDFRGDIFNTRDKMILELAWNGFSSEEIKNIKVEDILFKTNKMIISVMGNKRTLLMMNWFRT